MAKPFLLSLLLIIITPIFSSILFTQLTHDFIPAPLPNDHSFEPSIPIPIKHSTILARTERIGEGVLHGPEDLALERKTGCLYTGCVDGWIRRVELVDDNDGKLFKVEDWVHTGENGRPLGVAFGPDGSLFVADAYKGLLRVHPNKSLEILSIEAEGLKFGLTDGVDVASDGTIYFTDASYKYDLANHMADILEARPHGRLVSFDLSGEKTTVLARDLYFANGVSVAPDQKSLIYCETVVRRCRRYHIQGERKGTVEDFIDNLPGCPDNIRYDGEGHFWIGLSAGRTALWDTMFKYPFLRRILYAAEQFVTVPRNMRDSGVICVSLDGQPVALYSDPKLVLATGGMKVGNYLYYGSLYKSYISRIELSQDK